MCAGEVQYTVQYAVHDFMGKFCPLVSVCKKEIYKKGDL